MRIYTYCRVNEFQNTQVLTLRVSTSDGSDDRGPRPWIPNQESVITSWSRIWRKLWEWNEPPLLYVQVDLRQFRNTSEPLQWVGVSEIPGRWRCLGNEILQFLWLDIAAGRPRCLGAYYYYITAEWLGYKCVYYVCSIYFYIQFKISICRQYIENCSTDRAEISTYNDNTRDVETAARQKRREVNRRATP